MKLVVYLRVSTDQQVRDGQGLDIQEAQCRAWARRHHHQVVAVCREEGRSGGDEVADRPALAQALGYVYAGKADGVLVQVLSRLARDMILQEQFLAELHRLGKVLRSTSDAEDANLRDAPDDPQRAFIRRVLGAHDQYERDMIRLRLRAGRERKALLGGFAGGAVPYGYRSVNATLVPVAEEQAAIRAMRRLRGEGLSYRQIIARLERDGAPLPRRASSWRPATVAQIIARADNSRRGEVAAASA